MITLALLATFFVTYATGPAGKADLAARAVRLDFPRVVALSNEFGACGLEGLDELLDGFGYKKETT